MKSNIHYSVINFDEIIDTLDAVPMNYNNKKERYKIEYYILHTFFISNDNIVNNCYYLLLLHKKRHITRLKM